jgi:hypothetical protein
MWGDPHEIAADLKAFEKDHRVLDDQRDYLLKNYEDRWVAVYDGEIRTSATTFDEVLANVDALCIPRGRVVISLIERNIPPLKL